MKILLKMYSCIFGRRVYTGFKFWKSFASLSRKLENFHFAATFIVPLQTAPCRHRLQHPEAIYSWRGDCPPHSK